MSLLFIKIRAEPAAAEGRLLKDGREVDILKSLKEPGYQERLLMEYNL